MLWTPFLDQLQNLSQSQNEQTLTSADMEEAYTNYVTDEVITLDDNPTTNSVKSFLKGMQPYREKPRFAAGNLPLDIESPESHDVTVSSIGQFSPQ